VESVIPVDICKIFTSDMFHENSYSTAEDEARRCYFLRSIDRFAAYFGLAELNLKPRQSYREKYLVRKSILLDRFVSFN